MKTHNIKQEMLQTTYGTSNGLHLDQNKKSKDNKHKVQYYYKFSTRKNLMTAILKHSQKYLIGQITMSFENVYENRAVTLKAVCKILIYLKRHTG